MRRPLATVAAAALLAGMVLLLPGSGAQRPAYGLSYHKLNKIQRRILSGFATSELNPAATSAAVRPRSARQARPGDIYVPTDSLGCPDRKGSNVKANRNCLNLADVDLTGRSQANNETSVAIDPATGDLVMGDNDYRRGDSGCVAAYSRDGGRTWSDSEVPTGFTRGAAFGAAREYWQGAGDPAVATDTRGNTYFSCLQFNRGQPTTPVADASSAIYLYRSTGNAGASWNFPGRPVVETADLTGTSGVLQDKELLAVDNHRRSPFRDRVYVTWTEFAADGTAYIWSRASADYGESFGPRVLVSAASPACTNTFGLPTPNGPCNENQFSQPFVGPGGDLYVAWSNFNSAAEPPGPETDQPAAGDRAAQQPEQPGEDEGENAYQVLLARSTDGGASFGAPVKVSDYNDLPDCETYQDGAGAGSSCVPEKGATANSFFRAANYPVGAVDPTDPDRVVITFGSYINRHSNEDNGCVPAGFSEDTGNPLYTGVKTAGACNNDIVVSVSDDGGASFTGTDTDVRELPSATSATRQRTTDQWFHWAAFTRDGKLATSYYDRQYGDDELTGWSDFSLSGSKGLAHFGVRRVTTSSMPPPTQFAGGFFGDYTGLAADRLAYPAWSDTRNPAPDLCPGTGTPGNPPQLCVTPAPNAPYNNDQEIYTAAVPVPSG